MFNESALKDAMVYIPCLIPIITMIVHRKQLQWSRLKVEIINDAFKLNYRNSQILDFQINLRIQSINGKISLRKVTLICKKGLLGGKVLETFENTVNIGGNLTKYDKSDFEQFLCCIVAGCDCSIIREPESRFREFIQLKDLILEEDIPRPITLLGQISDYQTRGKFFLEFDYDLNGSRKKLSKKLDFQRFLKKAQNFSE